MLEQGNQGIILATFRNADMERLYTMALGGKNLIQISYEKRTIDEMLKEIENADGD
jgi:hypothetical protein